MAVREVVSQHLVGLHVALLTNRDEANRFVHDLVFNHKVLYIDFCHYDLSFGTVIWMMLTIAK